MAEPIPKYKRLFPGGPECRLKGAYLIKCVGYETDENGRLQSVCIEADGGAAFGARPTGLMQLALYAFAGAQKGHICFNRAIMDVTKRLKAQPQEAFSTVVDGVAVDYQYRAEGNCYRLMMTKTGVDK